MEKFQVAGRAPAVLPQGETAKYLGRALRLDCPNDADVEHQVNMALKCFMGMRDVLCNGAFPLVQQLKLFGATVSQTALYQAGTGTLKRDRARELGSAQWSMLRLMV